MKGLVKLRKLLVESFAITFMIMCFYFVSEGFRIGEWTYIQFASQLLFATLLILIAYALLDQLEINLFLNQMIGRYFIALFTVSFVGYFFNWYTQENYWLILLNVTVVFIVTYILGIMELNRDINEINELIEVNMVKRDE